MPAAQQIGLTRIGATLRRARARAGLDIRTVEERTKIRIKYLRALESEDWEVIPSAAYAKGFLRTYAGLLGLDPDALVDEYRRQVESGLPASSLTVYGKPVLEGRAHGPGAPGARRPRFPLLAGLGLLALATIVVLALLGGSGDNSSERAGSVQGRHAAEGLGAGPARHHGPSGHASAAAGPVSLRLHAKDGLQACLVTGDGRVLIDSQTLSRGAQAGPFEAKSYRLDLDTGGAVKVSIAGRDHVLRSREPASYKLRAGHARSLAFRGPGCP